TGRKIIEAASWHISAANPLRSFTLGNVQVVSAALETLSRIPKAEAADTLIMHAVSGGQHVGSFVGPFWGDLSIRAQIRLIMHEMQAEEHLQMPPTLVYISSWTREALRGYRAFGGLIIRNGQRRGRLERILVRIGRNALLACAPSDKQDNDARLSDMLQNLQRGLAPRFRNPTRLRPDEKKGAAPVQSEEEYWEHIFERPDPWNYVSVYEQVKYAQTLSLIPEGIEKALELACAEGIFTEKLAQKVGRVTATDISQRAIDRAVERCRDHRNIELRVLDFVKSDVPPEQDLIVCSEVLYYMKDEEMLAAVCQKI
ncbi:SAM-dependent methyltransferase, partial [Rhizobium ruizarguesonis]